MNEIINYDNGFFEGTIINRMRNGKYLYTNGDVFEGIITNDTLNGKCFYKNGDVFEGVIKKNGIRNGQLKKKGSVVFYTNGKIIKNKIVKCPECRVSNLIDIKNCRTHSRKGIAPDNYNEMITNLKILGIQIVPICCVCVYNYADVTLPTCKHDTICYDCVLKMTE